MNCFLSVSDSYVILYNCTSQLFKHLQEVKFRLPGFCVDGSDGPPGGMLDVPEKSGHPTIAESRLMSRQRRLRLLDVR